MIRGILSTDLALHFEMCKTFDAYLSSAKKFVPSQAQPSESKNNNNNIPAQQSSQAELLTFDMASNKSPTELDKVQQFLFDVVIHSADLQSVVVPSKIAGVRHD